MEEFGFHCTNHRVSSEFQQPAGWNIHIFFRGKLPFAVFDRRGGVSENKRGDGLWLGASMLNYPLMLQEAQKKRTKRMSLRRATVPRSRDGLHQNGRGSSTLSGLQDRFRHQEDRELAICTWVKTGRFGNFFVLSFLALGGHCLQMLCLPGFGTHADTQICHIFVLSLLVPKSILPRNAYFHGKRKTAKSSRFCPPTLAIFACFRLGSVFWQ